MKLRVGHSIIEWKPLQSNIFKALWININYNVVSRSCNAPHTLLVLSVLKFAYS